MMRNYIDIFRTGQMPKTNFRSCIYNFNIKVLTIKKNNNNVKIYARDQIQSF